MKPLVVTTALVGCGAVGTPVTGPWLLLIRD